MKHARGFSLLELVVVIVVVGIMAAALTPVVLSSLTAYGKTQGDLIVLDKLRYATERLAREIREVKYDGSTNNYLFTNRSTSAPAFTRDYVTCNDSSCSTTTTSTLTVTVATIDSSSSSTTGCKNANCITLTYSTPTISPAPILIDQVSSLAFAYYQANGTTLATSNSNVTAVEISLSLTQDGQPYNQRTRVELRNQ